MSLHVEAPAGLNLGRLGALARYRNCPVSTIAAEEEAFLRTVGGRHYGRYGVDPRELAAQLPALLAEITARTATTTVLLGRGTEPVALGLRRLSPKDLTEQLVYMPLFRRLHPRTNGLLAQTILTALSPRERAEKPSADEWDRLREAAKTIDADRLDQHLAERGGLAGLRRKTRADIVAALADFGIDDGFLSLYRRVRNIWFTHGFDLQALLTEVEQPTEAVVHRITSSLQTRGQITEVEATRIAGAVTTLAAGEGTIRSADHDLLLIYLRIALYADAAAGLRHRMEHAARPLLHALLARTTLARRLADREVRCWDEMTNSGTALLLAELALRSFAPTAMIGNGVLFAPTAHVRRVLVESGLVDSVVCGVGWLQEDLNELFTGAFVDEPGGAWTFRSFSQLCADLLALQPDRPGPRERAGIGELNATLDRFIDDFGLLRELDARDFWRASPAAVKRELVKDVLPGRSTHPLLRRAQAVVTYDTTRTFGPCNGGQTLDMLLRDRSRALKEQVRALAPPAVFTLDDRWRVPDLSLRIARLAERAAARQEEAQQVVADIREDEL